MPPFDHPTPLPVFVDPDLLQWPEVWAAESTWNDVFGMQSHRLVEASEGVAADPKRGWVAEAYTLVMQERSPLEDWRGVDIGQIRAQLRLSVADRVSHMVDVANRFMEIRRNVRILHRPEHE